VTLGLTAEFRNLGPSLVITHCRNARRDPKCYNITVAEIAAAGDNVKYFEGTPIPSSLQLVVVLALCFYWNRVGDDLPLGVVQIGSLKWHPLSLLYFLSGSAMISKTLKIPKL